MLDLTHDHGSLYDRDLNLRLSSATWSVHNRGFAPDHHSIPSPDSIPAFDLTHDRGSKYPLQQLSHHTCVASFSSLSLAPFANDYFVLYSQNNHFAPRTPNILFPCPKGAHSSVMRLNYQVALVVSFAPLVCIPTCAPSSEMRINYYPWPGHPSIDPVSPFPINFS